MVLVAAVSSCRREESPASKAADARPARPNIIFLTVDTLRADHLELYGYSRQTMPTVAALADRATVFDNAVVPRGSTRPSYASMLTGLYPFRHGVRSNGAVLHENITTLTERLQAHGYHTAGFVSNFVLVGEQSGCSQGFDLYDDHLGERELNRPNYERTAGKTLKAMLEWLAADPPQPFFLFTNFIDPHGPYHPPERFRKVFDSKSHRNLEPRQIPAYQRVEGVTDYYDYVDRYDAEIRYVDEALDIFVGELQRADLWDDSLVVFTADHGESLGEHGVFFEHHLLVYEETVRVPLAIRLPGAADRQPGKEGQRVGALCSPMDLTPTVLEYLDIPYNGPCDGRSLLPVIQGDNEAERFLFLEFPSVATPHMSLPDVYGIRTATHKLIRVLDPQTGKAAQQAVFHIAADPLEQSAIPYNDGLPFLHALGQRLDKMIAEMRDYELPFVLTEYEMPLTERPGFIQQRQQTGKRITKTLTDDQIERLRALGYVQ
ncbi:MAG: sulfatase [Planctomycetota bacterium]|jgi:arylsulfatase A-like enzyme